MTDDEDGSDWPASLDSELTASELAAAELLAELLAELRATVARTDPVPARVTEAALAAFDLRSLDAELAELIADSAVDSGALVRGGNEPRLVSFANPQLSVEFEVAGTGGSRRLIGQVVGPRSGPLELDHRAGVLPVTPDELGRFVVDGVSPGPVRLRCELVGGATVNTSWIVV